MSKKRKRPKEQYRYDPLTENEPEQNSKESKYRLKLVYLIDPNEVAELIAASQAPYIDSPREANPQDYPTYSIEEIVDLLSGTYKRRRRKNRSPETKS